MSAITRSTSFPLSHVPINLLSQIHQFSQNLDSDITTIPSKICTTLIAIIQWFAFYLPKESYDYICTMGDCYQVFSSGLETTIIPVTTQTNGQQNQVLTAHNQSHQGYLFFTTTTTINYSICRGSHQHHVINIGCSYITLHLSSLNLPTPSPSHMPTVYSPTFINSQPLVSIAQDAALAVQSQLDELRNLYTSS